MAGSIRSVLVLAVLMVFPLSRGWSQERLEKLQERWEKRWEEMRPKGKILKSIKDSLQLGESESASQEKARKPAQPLFRPPQSPAAARETDAPNWNVFGFLNPKKSNGKPTDEKSERPARRTQEPLASREPQRKASIVDSAAGRGVSLGVALEPTDGGMAIVEVVPGSPAERGGLKRGDVLVSFGGVPVADLTGLDDLLGALHPGDQVVVEVLRRGESKQAMIAFGSLAEQEAAAREASEPRPFDQPPLPPLLPGEDADSLPDLQSVLSPSGTESGDRPVVPSLLPSPTGSGARGGMPIESSRRRAP